MLPIQSKNLELTATIPSEMVNAQQELILWCDKKIAEVQDESLELKLAYEHAKKSRWKYSTLQNQYNKSVKRISFYEKIKTALLAGYYIVPNFPIQMFAIRTTKEEPSGYSNHYWDNHTQDEQELPIGEGEYKNPFPLLERVKGAYHSDTKTQDPSTSEAIAWQDVEFPVTMAKPQIMEATSRAMALELFDRIGIMPATKKEDPVIIGQIIHKGIGYKNKTVSFMIAWHLNTKDL